MTKEQFKEKLSALASFLIFVAIMVLFAFLVHKVVHHEKPKIVEVVSPTPVNGVDYTTDDLPGAVQRDVFIPRDETVISASADEFHANLHLLTRDRRYFDANNQTLHKYHLYFIHAPLGSSNRITEVYNFIEQ